MSYHPIFRLCLCIAAAVILPAACGTSPDPPAEARLEGGEVEVSPRVNGRIAFTRAGDIFTMEPDGSGEVRLTDGPASDVEPVWSPDGTRLAFTSDRGRDPGHFHVYTMTAGGEGVRMVSAKLFEADSPAWSPDGTSIALRGCCDAGDEVYTVDPHGTGLTQVSDEADDGASGAYWPAWSPDGTILVHKRIRYDAESQTDSEALYSMSSTGGRIERLTEEFFFDGPATWSPDGGRIAFGARREGDDTSTINVMNADGSGLTTVMEEASSPAWSPDGARIAFVSAADGDADIYVMNPDGSDVTRLTDTNVDDGEPAWQSLAVREGQKESPPERAGSKSPLDLPPGWTDLPLPPEVRSAAATAWTGERLLVWGGYVYEGFGDDAPQADGFAFVARARTWERIAPSPLSPRALPASAWTGSEFLVWGGWDDAGENFDDGAAYDPTTDTWRSLPEGPIGARAPLYVWTGRELIVWGARAGYEDPLRDGAAYDPHSNSWRTIAEAPIALTRATAAWTGTEMVVLGDSPEGNITEPAVGIAYSPATDTWRRLPDVHLAREASTVAWAGRELIAWDYEHRSAAYDPVADEWRILRGVPLEFFECGPQSVSIGERVFGDNCGSMVVFESAKDEWRDISRREFAGWGFELVAADPVVLLFGRNVDTGEERMLAYRPSKS